MTAISNDFETSDLSVNLDLKVYVLVLGRLTRYYHVNAAEA